MRSSSRKPNEIRKVSIEPGVSMNADGSCLVRFGNTHVICTASIDDKVPPFLKGKGKGWVTAEYGMLPGSTNSRIKREAAQGRQSGRTQEIQRLIGRSLRSVTDLESMGEIQITIDCDVIQADGGTRTASITGGYVALHLAFEKLLRQGKLDKIPLINEVAAISCGIYNDTVIADLDYEEDSNAEVDANFVMTGAGGIVEVQGTAEGTPFSEEEFLEMLKYARVSIKQLIEIQRSVLGIKNDQKIYAN